MDYRVHGILQARILESLSLGDLPNPEMEPRSPSLQVDSLPAEPQGKPKNTTQGVGSLFLLQGIFPTQELNPGLLHCRQILSNCAIREAWLKDYKKVCMYVLVTQSHLTLFDPWTLACQAPLSMGFYRQEYWSRLQFPFSGYLLNPGTDPGSPAL